MYGLFLLLALISPTYTPKFAAIFGRDYVNALQFYKEKQPFIEQRGAYFGQDAKLMAATVFPEWIRYSSFQDFFETQVLEWRYIEGGSTSADFSIGQCQMKPSFVEALESEILKKPKSYEKFLYLIPQGEETQKRTQRLQYLKQWEYQCAYLACFVKIATEKYGETFESEEEKVKVFAAAYNSGWKNTKATLLAQMKTATFPYGTKIPASMQYCYVDVAWDFWLSL